MAYDLLGHKTIIPQADLESLVSRANRNGDTRVGGDALGKRAGMEVMAKLTSDNSLKSVIALGALSSDAWRVVDGSANITPVNILNAGGGDAWTVSAGCTYAAGLLTADGVDDPTASQVVALKAGTYRIEGLAAMSGPDDQTPVDYDAPKLVVTGATDGAVLTKIYTGARYVTLHTELATADKEVISDTFTIDVDQNVTFAVSMVNEAGSLEAGNGYISITKLEAE
jgi:hypothetical protein